MSELGKLPMVNTLGMSAVQLIERAEAYEREAVHLRRKAIERNMSDGDECPRCESTDTWATQTWEEPHLVCRSCGYGT